MKIAIPDQKLTGKVALIGGASKNLGSLISKALAGQGAKVVVHFHSAASKIYAEEGGQTILANRDYTTR